MAAPHQYFHQFYHFDGITEVKKVVTLKNFRNNPHTLRTTKEVVPLGAMDTLWIWLKVIGGVVVTGMIALKIYVESIKGKCTSKADLSGQTVLITGANTGIGYHTALDLARRNARVVLACRDRSKGQRAVDCIVQATNNQNVFLRIVDLSLMKSVREFASTFIKEESRLDILINNAGMAGLPLTMTEEGLEMMFATNHFGPFLLTTMLLDLLKKSTPSRIVNVSSMAHRWASDLDFDNMKAEKSYDIAKQYFQTKLCNILFTRELTHRLENTGVTCYALHPGTVKTELLRHLPFVFKQVVGMVSVLYFKPLHEKSNNVSLRTAWMEINLYIYAVISGSMLFTITLLYGVNSYVVHPGCIDSDIWRYLPLSWAFCLALPKYLYFKSSEEGAQTSIYCAVSEDLRNSSGKYFEDCHVAEDQCSDLGKDMGLAKKLWEVSERITEL